MLRVVGEVAWASLESRSVTELVGRLQRGLRAAVTAVTVCASSDDAQCLSMKGGCASDAVSCAP